MREQIESLKRLQQRLREIFDAEDITVSDYPILASLTFGTSCMYSFHKSHNSQKFREALELALSSAEEIITPKKQDYYAFTNDVWYKKNACHDIVKSMLTTLRAINSVIGKNNVADMQDDNPMSHPRLTAY